MARFRLPTPRSGRGAINRDTDHAPTEAPAEPAASTPPTPTPPPPSPPGPRRRLRIPRPSVRRPSIGRPRIPTRRPRIPSPRTLKVLAAVAALLALALIAVAVDSGGGSKEKSAPAPAPAPRVSGAERDNSDEPAPPPAETAEELGFPAFATKNTTRVGGADSAANAAGVALATYPSAGANEPPVAVTFVGEDDWQAGIAASVLAAEPVRAPILVSTPDAVPSITEKAAAALSPQGSVNTDGAQAFAIGDVTIPAGLETTDIAGGTPAATAAAIDQLRSRLVAGQPDHIVIASFEQPEFAMPAAAWAARSGDPVLFAGKTELPKPTEDALKRHEGVPVYVLGPASVISSRTVRQISRIAGTVKRVGGEDPVLNAIEFARYADGSFGWNLNDPGHGFVVARSDRPLDAAAAAPLSSSGTWGPLLLTDSADTLPGALRGYLLDVKPGYQNDPTRALYNHVWIIGDQDAIDVTQQATIDELAELARIGGEPEQESPPPEEPEQTQQPDGSGSTPDNNSGGGGARP